MSAEKTKTSSKDKAVARELGEDQVQVVLPKGEEKFIKTAILLISLFLCVFHVYTSFTVPLAPMVQRSVHLAAAVLLVYLYAALKSKHLIMRLLCYAVGIIGLLCCIFVIQNWDGIALKASSMSVLEIGVGIALVVIVIDIARRSIGIWMPLIAGVFVAYCYFGRYMTGVFKISSLSLNRFVNYLSYGTEGIFGTCLGASATFVFMFILYSEFLIQLGAGDFVIKAAESALGSVRGGPAKIAVVASALFGTVSGSAVANVAGTGCLTIPMMKKKGFPPEFAGGVESAASTGGQLMPPVMGTAAFIMSELISISYSAICIAAIIPAILYFFGVLFMVDLKSVKMGLKGVPKEELPVFKEVFKEGWHYVISIVLLIVLMLGFQWSPSRSCLWSGIVLIAAHLIRKAATGKKIEWNKTFDIATKACKSVLTVATSTACAGIVVGAFTATGLNLRFSKMLVDLSGGHLPVLLVLCMIGAIILGM